MRRKPPDFTITAILTMCLLLALPGLAPVPVRAAPAITTRRAAATGSAAGTAVANVRVSHDTYPAHAEPSIAVNPRDPRNLLGACMFISPAHPSVNVLGTFASFDGGQTWRDNGALPLPAGTAWGDDVTVAFDAHGTGFVDAMATSGVQRGDRNVFVWRTDDGGRTFHAPVPAMSHQFADHPWLVADTSAGPGSGDLYAAWVAQDHAALGFTRSTDGGRHFDAPRSIATPSGGVSIPVVAAGPSGAVYVAFESSRQGFDVPDASDVQPQADRAGGMSSNLRMWPGRLAGEVEDAQIEVVSSSNHGRTFGRPVALGPVPSQLAPGGGLLLSTGPSVAVDPRDGTAYVVYAAYIASTTSAAGTGAGAGVSAGTGAGHYEILLARSQNGGRTWSTPVRVAPVGGPHAAILFQPQVVVDGSGAVDVSYFALAHGSVDVMLTRSATHGTAFNPPLRITSRAFNPTLGLTGNPKHGLWWIGDYQGLASGGGLIHPFWNDTRPGRLEIFTAAVPATL